MLKKILPLICFLFVIMHGPALAQSAVKKLNESNIEQFIIQTTKLTSGSLDDLSPDKIVRYLEKHLHKNSRFKTTMNYHIPGHPTQESAMSFSKKEFINNVRQGAGSVSEYENQVEIIKIKIASNKKSATVETRSTETASIPVQGENGIEEVPMEGSSLCRQILKLSKKGIIQMYNINCVTEIQFTGNGL